MTTEKKCPERYDVAGIKGQCRLLEGHEGIHYPELTPQTGGWEEIKKECQHEGTHSYDTNGWYCDNCSEHGTGFASGTPGGSSCSKPFKECTHFHAESKEEWEAEGMTKDTITAKVDIAHLTDVYERKGLVGIQELIDELTQQVATLARKEGREEMAREILDGLPLRSDWDDDVKVTFQMGMDVVRENIQEALTN